MNGGSNYLPWIVLAVVVLATLAFKGYLKPIIDAFRSKSAPSIPKPSPLIDTPNKPYPMMDPYAYAQGLSSNTLGLLFVQAKRREAEAEHAESIARAAGESIKATFTAPFSPPADPAPVGGPPGGQ